jgi:hypothetical protein
MSDTTIGCVSTQALSWSLAPAPRLTTGQLCCPLQGNEAQEILNIKLKSFFGFSTHRRTQALSYSLALP